MVMSCPSRVLNLKGFPLVCTKLLRDIPPLSSEEVYSHHTYQKSNGIFFFALQIASVYISENGLKITVEDCKYIQASAFVQAEMFQEFTCKQESGTFQINLAVMLVSIQTKLLNFRCLVLDHSIDTKLGNYVLYIILTFNYFQPKI